jgi:hypothetical protein
MDWNLVVGLLVLIVSSATLYIAVRERRASQRQRKREGRLRSSYNTPVYKPGY